MQIMEKAVTSSNGTTGRGSKIKEGVANFEKGTRFISIIGIFLIWIGVDSFNPISLVIGIVQNMALIVGDEGVISAGVLRVVGYYVIKGGGNFKRVIKAGFASLTVVDGDCDFDFTRTLFAFNNFIKSDGFVIWNFKVQTIIEISDVIGKRRLDKAVANFHGCHGRLDFFS